MPFLRNVFKILKVVKNYRGNDIMQRTFLYKFCFASFSHQFFRVMWIIIVIVNPNDAYLPFEMFRVALFIFGFFLGECYLP